MEPTFSRYIRKYTWREQIYLLVLTAFIFPFLYYSLELPKVIVNKAIGSDLGFPKSFLSIELDRLDYLFALCALFLLLVGIRFALRYYINVYKGQLGERMLRRIRYQLFSRVLRFPLPHFRKASQGEIIAMITAEVEPLGGFVGEALATPAFEGGTMLTILAFMFVQDPILGVAAIALFPVQAYIIPKLQKQVNALAKERVRTVRKLSERIGEVVSGIEGVHTNDTAELERADIARWLGTIYGIRFQIYRKKFFIKFLNNVLGQVTPFFFYAIGGYLVIMGDLTFGALVAVLAAYKDLSSPWKELLKWYQVKEDSRIKYDQLIQQFDPPGILDEVMQQPGDAPAPRLSGVVQMANVSLEEEDGIRIVDGVSLTFNVDERVALVGREGSGNGALSRLIARLLAPTSGTIAVGGMDLATCSESVTGQRIGYVGHLGTLFQGTIADNLYYALRHRQLREAAYDDDRLQLEEKFRHEAVESGNTPSDPQAEWIDYAAMGLAGPDDLLQRASTILGTVGLAQDVFGFGLQGTLDPVAQPDLAARLLEARATLHERLNMKGSRGLVETFDAERFIENLSVGENILFGTPIGPELKFEHIAENAYMLSVLDRVGLVQGFVETGLQVAKIMLELFQDVEPGDELFHRFSFISVDALPDYQAAVRRVDAEGLDHIAAADRTLFLSLPFMLVPARHRLGLITPDVEGRLLEARKAFADGLPEDLRGSVDFFDRGRYNAPASVQDNILFGRLVYGRPQAQRQVGALVDEVLDELGLRGLLIGLGLDYSVGIGGTRLSAVQRQKLVIARALIKAPDLLIMDQATAALDPASQMAIMNNILDSLGEAGLVWVMNDADQAVGFDRVIVMDHGRVVEQRAGEQMRTDRAVR